MTVGVTLANGIGSLHSYQQPCQVREDSYSYHGAREYHISPASTPVNYILRSSWARLTDSNPLATSRIKYTSLLSCQAPRSSIECYPRSQTSQVRSTGLTRRFWARRFWILLPVSTSSQRVLVIPSLKGPPAMAQLELLLQTPRSKRIYETR